MKKAIKEGIAAGRVVKALIKWAGPVILNEANPRAQLIGVLLTQITVIFAWAGSIWVNRDQC